MADGNFVHESSPRKGAMVFGPTVQDVPLLPYEKQLIKTIGITEKEYQLFAAEVRQRGRLRPTEYEHIPDVQAVETAILVQIAISLVLTGVAYLLTPKPKMPGSQKSRGGSVVDLGNITGANRFTPSRGFDTLAELADYTSPIPLVFGRYDKGNSNRGHSPSGGMLVTPKLVWSRMFSHGTLQRAKLLFVVGEQGLENGIDSEEYLDDSTPSGIKKPALEGIFLGNNALDHVFDDFFAFYWKPNSDFSRKIRNGDRVYGTAGRLDSGDPDASGDNNKGQGKTEEVFLCSVPNEEDENVSAFCHAYSPANSTQFGTYAPIANGTGFRLNYKIVSIFPAEEGRENRSKEVKRLRQQTLARIKIAGDQNLFKDEHNGDYGNKGGVAKSTYQEVREQNQRSLGRNYSPRMGVVRLVPKGTPTPSSGNDIIAPSAELKTTESVSKGDRIKFLISSSSIAKDFYHNSTGKGESVEDINSSVESMELAADSAMQLGEVFSIAGSIWKVTNRDVSLFTAEEDQVITLECIDTTKSLTSKIGIVSKHLVVDPDHEYIGDSQPGGVDKNNSPVGGQNIGEAFFPLTRFETAIVKNNRPAIVTEIGLKSIVYQKLNGLCSFNGLPDPVTLAEYEDDNAQVNSGVISSSILRASVFRIFIRKAGLNKRNEPYVLHPLQHAQGSLSGHVYFVIRGTRPVAQYNFIRIVNTVAEELEFEFVPVSGAELRAIDDGTIMLELLSSAPLKSYPASVSELKGSGQNDGLMVEGTFKQVSKKLIEENKEFFRDASEVSEETVTTYPLVVARSRALPDANFGTGPSEIARVSNISSHNEQGGKMGAFGYDVLGTADDRRVGATQITRTQEIVAGHDKYRWVSLSWKFQVAALPEDHYARQNGAKNTWVVESVSVIGSTQGFQEEQEFNVLRGAESTEVGSNQVAYNRNDNPFAKLSNSDYMTWSGRKFKITKTKQIEVVGGRAQGYFHELFQSAQRQGISGGEGTLSPLATVQASINDGQKTISLTLQSRVNRQIEDTTNFTGIRHYTWDFPTITVNKTGTTQNWEVGDKFTDIKVITTGNPFKSSYPSTGFEYQIKDLDTENIIHEPLKTPESAFALQTQYSDISHYREYVEKSNASEPEHQVVYVNEILPNSKGPKEGSPSPRFNNLTLAGLSLKAGRNFSQLDQLRCWISDGIQVERLHPELDKAYGDTNPIGSSNLFTDLVYYLFTDQIAGAGALLGMTRENPLLIDKDAMIETSKFLRKNKLFFNGAIAERTNLRQFVMDLAPNFLCNFVISNGKFSLTPAVPAEGAVTIDHYFTSGNILEDTFKIEYLRSEERRPFKAIVRYREERQNKLPEEKTLTVRGKGEVFDPLNLKNIELPPDEQFDLTQFCTSKRHAVLAAKYFLSLRGLVTHTISFSTTVHGLKIGAGSYIKVTTESSPYNSAYNGTVSSGGVVTSVEPLSDGQYEIIFYKAGAGSADIDSGVMQVSNGHVQNENFRGIVFALKTERRSENVYVVEQLTFSQEGTVDIVASEHPCNEDGSSKLTSLLAINVETEDGEEFEDVYTDDNFVVFD